MEPPTRWQLDLRGARPGEDLVAVGADLAPGTVLAAYRAGLFPMPVGHPAGRLPGRRRRRGAPVAWWSPDPRAVLPLDGLRVSRSLRRSCGRFETRVDTAFDAVVAACADPTRDGAWITPEVATAYGVLHRLGWAHSVETWSAGQLIGGLYGIGIRGLFAGESMFHRATDASKVALVALVDILGEPGDSGDCGDSGPAGRLLDVQWLTPHLASLGCVEVPREDYLRRLAAALELAPPAWPGAGPVAGPGPVRTSGGPAAP